MMEIKIPIVSSEYCRQRIVRAESALRACQEELLSNEDMWRHITLRKRRMILAVNIENLKKEENDRNSLLAEMTLLFEKIVDKPNHSEYGDDSEDHY